ncbi:hypothetical protein STRDD13_00015 [Streptococcus sp. DD13]|nr:metallophosphoesterase [Streptococcus sp. DD13]KXT79317.1 hypothetical protein STRDD13_00015 [Streptococcus sp. DD13]
MTRLGFMSDLHIDSNAFEEFEYKTLLQVLQDRKIDHLHLVGDISNDLKGTSLPFIEKLRQYLPVSFSLGNHDMLGLSEKDIAAYDFQIETFGKTHLVSLAGWYDYSYAPQMSQKEHLAKKKLYWFDRKLDRTLPDIELTQTILGDLDRVLSDLDGTIIVALHFVPHASFLLQHPYFQAFNGFLGSQGFHDVFKKIRSVMSFSATYIAVMSHARSKV